MAKTPTPTGQHVDTWEMVVVHRMFRREFGDMPALVGRVAAGDRHRADLVGDHIAQMTDGLHHHHTGEDDLLWPALLARVGELDGELVQRMESQHENVAALLERVDELLPQWRRTANATTRDELASTLARASEALNEHLDDEETEILPLVSIYVTHDEWKALGDRGKASLPKGSKGFVFLGAILHDATPDERTRFLAMIPAPVRLVHRLVGNGIYQRTRARLHAA